MGIKKQTEFEHPEYLDTTGRPTKYRTEYNEQARKLCLLGYTDEELATFFNVATSTLYLWKLNHPSFSEAIRKGKDVADAEVAASLYERAKGYSHKETDIKVVKDVIVKTQLTKHYPPDTAAAIIWLKNRRRDKWRDKQADDDAPPVIVSVEVKPEEAKQIADAIKASI